MEVLAVIPARGGSKGLKRKNLIPLLERPLIAWSIEAAKGAQLVTRAVVSTDDPEIAAVARAEGAEVPFARPTELATDEALDLPVFIHALAWLAEHDRYRPDVVVHLRPTSPIRPPGLVDAGIRTLLKDSSADSVRAVCVAPLTPYKMWHMADGWLKPLLGSVEQELYNQPRQQLPVAYWQTGSIDVIRTSVIEAGSMTGRRILGLEVPSDISIDIDDQDSFIAAAAVMQRQIT